MTIPCQQQASRVTLLLRRIINRIGRPFGINPFPGAFDYHQELMGRYEAFKEIYQENFWGSEQSLGGVGSELEFTKRYRRALRDLIQQKGFHSVFDAPCGDLNWMPHLLKETPIHYFGGDISVSLVEELARTYPHLAMRRFDVCHDAFPKADVWHCRDCFLHLPFEEVLKALRNFVDSEIPYALLTTHRARWLHRNLDLNGIGFRYLDLERAPISLPKPVVYLPDYRPGLDFPRYVGLWSREMVKKALEAADRPVVYVVDASVAVTGAFVAARSAAQALAGTQRTVLVLPEKSSIPAEELQDFWRVEYLPIVNLSKNISALLRYMPMLFYTSWRLKQMMRNDGAMQLLLNDFFLMQGVVMRLLGFRGRITSWVRCEPRRFAGLLARPMLWLMACAANRVVAVSSFVRSLLAPTMNAVVVYDCYSGSVRTPRVWRQDEEKTFVCIGNYIRGKGQDRVLDAFARVAGSHSSLKLAFYGGDMGLAKNRDYRKELEAKVRRLGLEGRVSFGGFLPDTYPVLETAYAALNFSGSESFSLTVLEASGAGVPVVATTSGGPQEIIEDGVTGFLVPVGDVGKAAERMLMLAKDQALAAQMGEAGAKRVAEKFSPETFRSQLKAALNG